MMLFIGKNGCHTENMFIFKPDQLFILDFVIYGAMERMLTSQAKAASLAAWTMDFGSLCQTGINSMHACPFHRQPYIQKRNLHYFSDCIFYLHITIHDCIFQLIPASCSN